MVCDPSKIDEEKGVTGAPDLVVEVLSPSTAKRDKVEKKNAYERGGVKEYWIVSPKEGIVDQYVLADGNLVLRGVYVHFTPRMLERLDEKARAEAAAEFHCTLFDDLTIRLDDIFGRTGG